jgi:hypothetical protein
MKYLIIFISFFTFSQNNKLIPVDEETLEFIEEVKYSLFLKNKKIYTNTSSKDTLTYLPININYDSISFFKINYKEVGFKKDSLKEVILLQKKILELNEIVLIAKTIKEQIIGEKSRFVKRFSKCLSENIIDGIIFKEDEINNILINKLVFYVNKIKYKTTYKLKFFEVTEMGNPLTTQTLQINNLLYESPVFSIEKGIKDKVEIDLRNYSLQFKNKNIFVFIELQNYFDDNNNIIKPESKNTTKLKYQMSSKANYYSKIADYYTNELSTDLYNINQMINFDFAKKFFEKPHKSILVSPAILILGTHQN